ncbi:alcohol dehydrogenase catalytic domain-containing protein [Lactobacillus sp. DCY120]|uniref:Alcohol dehydrogenase catalytic domain-containing protein n=1 Tax=Bombilactobacillus apium TaxID=2675299 RepID=A0A850QZA3_9LACO|nr:alcohol dehydrogenase catalytic domain-containing protein [Bombilactobacillus apium]NVY96099.1 alcohol dehydrogenase catalytic domain-containing protein [Bombilactobacillus apium]
MKTTIFVQPGKVELKEVPLPTIQAPDDVLIKVLRTCVCGSDLWAYRGLEEKAIASINGGHEALGIVQEVGDAVTTVQAGDLVIAPFTHGCGHCAACRAGFDGCCQNHADNFSDGDQGEYIRYQHGDWSLVKVPGKAQDYSPEMLNSLLTLADVMATGYHAAKVAEVQAGSRVAVIGDGAVGLCGVIATQMLGAQQIILLGHHQDHQALAQEFGATDFVTSTDPEIVAQTVVQLTQQEGVSAVLECVGNQTAIDTALQICRPGAIIGRVGLPHTQPLDAATAFYQNIRFAGGPASVTTYDKEVLLKAVLDGSIHPGRVFNQEFTLDQIDAAYQAMVKRQAIKSLVVVAEA